MRRTAFTVTAALCGLVALAGALQVTFAVVGEDTTGLLRGLILFAVGTAGLLALAGRDTPRSPRA